jgi:hypothetical protein
MLLLFTQITFSQGFHIGDSVAISSTSGCINVRSIPSTISDSTIASCFNDGTLGRIVEGSSPDISLHTSYIFWRVVWQNGLAAWCAEKYMRATVSIPPATQVPIVNFSASPTSFSTGGGVVTFYWTTQYATYVGIEGLDFGFLAMNDSLKYLIKSSQTFTLNATNNYGMVQKSVTVLVATPPPPAPLGFVIGGRVMVSLTVAVGLNIRSVPSTVGNYPIGMEKSGNKGTIVGGPQSNNWWKIQWDDGRLGWSVQDYLTAIGPEPPPLYPSIKDQYDSTAFTTSGFDLIILQTMAIRKGSADTTITTPQFYFTRPQPVGGMLDTTYIQATYRFTKPSASVEK